MSSALLRQKGILRFCLTGVTDQWMGRANVYNQNQYQVWEAQVRDNQTGQLGAWDWPIVALHARLNLEALMMQVLRVRASQDVGGTNMAFKRDILMKLHVLIYIWFLKTAFSCLVWTKLFQCSCNKSG